MLSKEMIRKGLEEGIIKIVESPRNDGPAFTVGDEIFYFGGPEAERYGPEEYIQLKGIEKIVDEIYLVFENLRNYGWFRYWENTYEKLVSHLESQTHKEAGTTLTDIKSKPLDGNFCLISAAKVMEGIKEEIPAAVVDIVTGRVAYLEPLAKDDALVKAEIQKLHTDRKVWVDVNENSGTPSIHMNTEFGELRADAEFADGTGWDSIYIGITPVGKGNHKADYVDLCRARITEEGINLDNWSNLSGLDTTTEEFISSEEIEAYATYMLECEK